MKRKRTFNERMVGKELKLKCMYNKGLRGKKGDQTRYM